MANYVRDVPSAMQICAALVEKVRLRGAVPLGSAKHAGVNAACRWCGKNIDCDSNLVSVVLAQREICTKVGAPDPQRCAAVASAHLGLHTLTSVHLHLHTLTSADLPLYLHTPTHLHIYITPAHPHCHSFTCALSVSLSTYHFSSNFRSKMSSQLLTQ